MIMGCWKAAVSPDEKTGATFAADAIISNPPAVSTNIVHKSRRVSYGMIQFAHVHIAERLGVPLLLSFSTYILFQSRTMWTDSHLPTAMPWYAER